MAWKIVKQPNGLYAKFSDVVDEFTRINMPRETAVNLCFYRVPLESAESKVRRADEHPDRWAGCLDQIEMTHGPERLREVLAKFEDLPDPTPTSSEDLPAFVTCKDKGGSYVVIGGIKGAGTEKGKTRIAYKCLETGQIYYREQDNFAERMQECEPPATMYLRYLRRNSASSQIPKIR